MRTGAIFARRARGSCAALKWAALLGGFLVLGSVQAVAQPPTIEDASYTDAQPNAVVVKMSEDVYGDGAVEMLPGDFTLTDSDEDTPALMTAFRIDGLQNSRFSADDSFTLVFDDKVAGLALYYAGPITNGSERSIENEREEPLMAITSELAITLRGPKESRELTFKFTPAEIASLAMARMKGDYYTPYETFVATGDQPAIILPAAEGPPGATITYMLASTRSLLTIEAGVAPPETPAAPGNLYFENDPDVRAISGTMPNSVADYEVTYTATIPMVGTFLAQTASETFYLRVAGPPDAPVISGVETVSNSSIKVSWRRPNHNNDPITHYELGYRFEGQDEDVLTWAIPVATDTAALSYTLAGLDPGTYEVRVRGVNFKGYLPPSPLEPEGRRGAWSRLTKVAVGETGTGPQAPKVTLAVDASLPEGQDTIPVTVTATVEPSAEEERTLTVQLKLLGQRTPNPETNAELPTKTAPLEPNPDVSWKSPYDMDPPEEQVLSSEVEFRFTSNLSSEETIYLTTGSDTDAEDENFRITATWVAVPNVFSKAPAAGAGTTAVTVDDAEVQVYELKLPYEVGASMEFMEGYGGSPLPVELEVSPPRTVATNYIVALTSQEDASDYSLLSPSSGSPSQIGTRVSLSEGSRGEDLKLTPVQNDGDRVDDTITLQLFKANAAGVKGTQLGDDVVLTVLDRHKLPTVSRGSIMVDGNMVTSLAEGEKGTVELLVDRGTTTDAVPDSESIKVMLSLAATSEAGADDYRIGSPEVSVGTSTKATFELEAIVDEADFDDEMLVLQAEVTGLAANGPGATVDLAAITITDGTMRLVWPKADEDIQAVIYPAKEAGEGDDMMFNPGETIEIAAPGSMFNYAEGVTLSYTAMSDMEDVATVAVSGGMVTVTAQDMAGVMAHITITAHASMAAAGAQGLPQTDPSEASIIFPVEVGLAAVSFTLSGPEDMNLAEGGMAMVTATASRAVTADTIVTLMRDRAESTAADDDYMAEAITIEAGMMTGTTMVMAVEDDRAEEMEELVLYGMAADNAGEVTGKVKLYIWDAAVPALPLIAQLLLGLFLAIGGYRRYLRR